jgi:hypothetical protein
MIKLSSVFKVACFAGKTDTHARGFNTIQEICMKIDDDHQCFIYSLCTNYVGSVVLTDLRGVCLECHSETLVSSSFCCLSYVPGYPFQWVPGRFLPEVKRQER